MPTIAFLKKRFPDTLKEIIWQSMAAPFNQDGSWLPAIIK